MPQFVTQECWVCGRTEMYDCLSTSYPRGWAEMVIAGGVHDLCATCSRLKTKFGWSDLVLSDVKRRHGIELNRDGEVLRTAPSDQLR